MCACNRVGGHFSQRWVRPERHQQYVINTPPVQALVSASEGELLGEAVGRCKSCTLWVKELPQLPSSLRVHLSESPPTYVGLSVAGGWKCPLSPHHMFCFVFPTAVG